MFSSDDSGAFFYFPFKKNNSGAQCFSCGLRKVVKNQVGTFLLTNFSV